MRTLSASRSALLFSVAGLAISVPGIAIAQSETQVASQGHAPSGEIVITGVRSSLTSAQKIKRHDSQIVDSVLATDIGKFPDANTNEVLQRIPGVQIQRHYGEGSADVDHKIESPVAIRGLTEVEDTIDGRAVFSASGGRVFDLESYSPELLSRLDVYKNPAAEMIEGGIGGVVNLRTRLPFDSRHSVLSFSAKGNYYDRAKKYGGSFSGLYSTRTETPIGEMGFLINMVYSRSSYRQDAILIAPFGAPALGSIVGAPANAEIPLNLQVYDEHGKRSRLGINLAYQWQMSPDLLLTAQAQRTHYTFLRIGAYYYGLNYSPQPLPGAAFSFNQDGYATKGTIRQVAETSRYDQDLRTDSGNYTVNLAWTPSPRLKSALDLQYIGSQYNAWGNGLQLTQFPDGGRDISTFPNPPILDFDLTGKYPRWNFRDPAFATNINNYYFDYLQDTMIKNRARQFALAPSLEYDLGDGFLRKLRVGARYSDSGITQRATGDYTCPTVNGPDPTCSGTSPYLSLSKYPQLFEAGPSNNFFDGNTNAAGLIYPNFLPGSDLWNSMAATMDLLGAHERNYFLPQEVSRQKEATLAGYVAADYKEDLAGVPVDGNIGVRLVKTRLTSIGLQINADGSMSPLTARQNYTYALPTFNLRAELTPTFQVRAAYSKSIARPTFDLLTTVVYLGDPTQLDPATHHPKASAGNPYLKPYQSDNYDLTAEWYFAKTGSLIGDVFYKKVKNFGQGGTYTATFNNTVYDVSSTLNAGRGTIKGFELSYQQFFDFLPSVLSGLGVQANYTYIYSNVANPFYYAGGPIPQYTPLQKLSKNNYNLVGLYEKGPVSARIAWTWRSAYYDTNYGSGLYDGSTQYQGPTGSLDASLSVNVSKNLSVTVDAVNLLNQLSKSYVFTPNQPLQETLNDRRFGLSIRATY